MIGITRKKIKKLNLPKFLIEIINNYDILNMNEIKDIIHTQMKKENYDISLNLLYSILNEHNSEKFSKEEFMSKITLVYDLNEFNLNKLKKLLENDNLSNKSNLMNVISKVIFIIILLMNTTLLTYYYNTTYYLI